jgi:hypothetical protein
MSGGHVEPHAAFEEWRTSMGGNPVLPSLDTFILAAPILALLAMMMFGLDERSATSRRGRGTRRFFCEVGVNDTPSLSDPDGRPWRKKRIRRVEATLIEVGGPGWDGSWSDKQAAPANSPIICGYVIEKE